MSDDFQLPEWSLTEQIIDDILQESVARFESGRIRLLATCYAKGYDGVDFYAEKTVCTNPDDFRLSQRYDAWEGEPPETLEFPSPTQLLRYDFRHLTHREEVELLSHIGLAPEDIPLKSDGDGDTPDSD